MDGQLPLFEKYRHPITPQPCDPHSLPEDRPRLTGQNATILDALKSGPMTNKQLSFLSLKYTSRISDLRAHGHRITCTRLQDGLTLYRLED